MYIRTEVRHLGAKNFNKDVVQASANENINSTPPTLSAIARRFGGDAPTLLALSSIGNVDISVQQKQLC
jgi:hypothetical protein